ncbi:DNA-protecting protein DprA [Candidatus Parcubacteria bacterium]|nr:DNA-protecting protein DprA [Candidatus Parcubacteria bacterium]
MEILNPENFPLRLSEIPKPPGNLYYRGELPSWDDYIFLAVVGSRNYTNYGKNVTEKLIGSLAGKSVVIVSGLALGTDALAHKAALQNNLKTIAVPGSGLDNSVIAPRTNYALAQDILKAGGALISEFDPKFKAAPWAFPQRNRIMAGLAHAVLVIEAGEKSGTLITAKIANDYGRDVLAVPGSIFSESSKGANKLLHQGATPITCVEDLHEALGLNVDSTQQELPLENFTEKEIFVLRALREPKSRDDLISELSLPIYELNITLSMLEIKGVIKEDTGLIRRIS